MAAEMTPRKVVAFIRSHGVVLESAQGAEPSLAAHIAGSPIKGNWWSHKKSHQIFWLTQHVRASKAVLVCTLAHGKITYIHRRLWPYFVRVSRRFPAHALDKVQEVHLPSGRHERQDILFPDWVPQPVFNAVNGISNAEAAQKIQHWLQRYGAAKRRNTIVR
jgi:hypothetical protein